MEEAGLSLAFFARSHGTGGTMDRDVECLIIGGGPAGLTAALYLARFRRRVLVVDCGNSRAAQIPKSRNYPGFPDGLSGKQFLAKLGKQARNYKIACEKAEVSKLVSVNGKFTATVGGLSVQATCVLLATGLTDLATAFVPKSAVAKSRIRFCPVCDAYECIDKRVAVWGEVAQAESKALFLRTYTRQVTIYATGARPSDAKVRSLCGAGVKVLFPLAIADHDGKFQAELEGGGLHRVDVIYPACGCVVHSRLAVAMGARCNATGLLIVDAHQKTSIDGLYAAGDVVSDLHQISVATGHAAIAATAIHNGLPRNFR